MCFGTILKLQPGQAIAATTSTVNFQARLMTSAGAIVPDGDYNVEFKLYNALTSTGSSQGSCTGDSACLWTETRISSNKVHVVNGYLTVDLGGVTAFPNINWDQNLYLTMNIGGTGTASWDGEMSPRLKLTAVPYAFRAGQLATLNGSNVSTLGFVQPTANRSILLPDESGTLCIQASANCGFALSSGSGNYIQNGTSLQAGANFNISGTGTAATSFLTPLLDTPSAGALAIGTTNATSISLNKATSVTGNLSQSGGTISLAATGTASVTATGTLSLSGAGTTVSSTTTTTVSAASGNTLTLSTSGTGQVQIASGTGGIALKANGGSTVLNVDTSANRVTAGVNAFGTASATGTGQLYVSGANNAAIAGSAAMGNTTYRVAAQGRYAYVQVFNALKVVDTAVPTSPVVVGSATTTSGVSALAAGAGYVYSLSNGGGTLQAVDVSNPSSPAVISTTNVTSPYAGVVSGRYLYVVTQDTSANFRVYDLANPGNPRLVTTLTASGGSVPYAIAVQGKYAYLASAGILQSINISNPASPVSAGTLAVNSATSIAVQGKYAYLVNSGNSRFQVVNIANPASMTSVSNTIATPSDAQEVVVQNRIAYVTSGTGQSLRWYDISNPASPVILGTYNAASALRGISVQGRYAYIADNGASALDVIDLGGAYLQQVEAGGLQATNLTVDANSILGGDVTVGGSLQVAQTMQVNGNFSTSGSALFQSATNSATAFQIQNASGTTLFNVDTTSNGLITTGAPLRLNVTATNATTFTTPLASSVPTAINIPLYNPGAYGQLLAMGLPSTADVTARAISVFDARSSGTIQPAIALFSPNENDVFGLSWNGLNTVASLETASAAIALRPGGTNVKLWAGSTGVAVGSNVSSASYPLDVTGDINTSTQLRIAGTVICTSTGCTPAAGSANYIQNTATVQSANMYVQAATSGSVAAVLRSNAAGAGDILDLKNGAGANVATFGSTGAVLLQNSTDSANAFTINTSAGGTNQNVFRVDTVSERVAIGVIGGTPSAKLNIATSTAVGLRVYSGGANNSFELANATTNTMTVDQNGLTLHKTTTNSVNAFQIQNNTTGIALNVDTTNLRVGIGGITTPAVSLDVQGAIQQTGLTTSNTNGTDANKWTLLGTCTIAAQYRQCIAGLSILGGHDGNGGDNTQATLTMRVKQQNAMGGAPYVNITMNGTAEVITKDDIVAVTTQNDATATVVQLYGRITNTYEQWYFTPTMNTDQSPSKWVWSASSGFLAALPAGTQTISVYGDDYANSLTVRPSANSTTAFKVQNAAGTNTAFSVDSGNLRVAVGGSFNPQETVDVVGNLQVRDATTATKGYRLRTSGGGLDFEGAGANLVLSMWSGAGYTGTQYNQITFKNDGSSMDFARGFNISSGTAKVGMGGNTNPQYALDVTGEINASVGLRVNGTTVCDTTGSTGCVAKSGSGYYIHNQTTQQTANLNMISAATNSITALFQGASGQTANILQVNDGSSNALLTVGTGTVTIGNGGNTVTFGSGFEPTLAGNARHQKSIVLTPEFAGAVLDATNDATCSSANSGTMTSALDLTNRMNYYKWSANGAAQCYNVVVQLQVPSDWAAWNGTPTVSTYTSDTTNGTIRLEIRDTTGGVETNNNFTSVTPTTTTTWQARPGGTLTGSYTAGQVMTLRIRLTSPNAGDVRLGNITLNYYSKY